MMVIVIGESPIVAVISRVVPQTSYVLVKISPRAVDESLNRLKVDVEKRIS